MNHTFEVHWMFFHTNQSSLQKCFLILHRYMKPMLNGLDIYIKKCVTASRNNAVWAQLC